MLSYTQRALARFDYDKRANVSITFALVLLPLFAIAGAVMDYSRATQHKSRLQIAADAAALAAAQAAGNVQSDPQGVAERVFAQTLGAAAQAVSLVMV